MDVNGPVIAAATVGGGGPHIEAINKVNSATVVGACLGAALLVLLTAAASCLLYRRHRQLLGKRQGAEQPLAFHAHRRPTAVRSPAGATTHYLKKSPSPTNVTKTPPGAAPSSNNNNNSSSGGGSVPSTPSPTPPTATTPNNNNNSEETNEEVVPDVPIAAPLGRIVFKLRYREERNALTVSVVRCGDLPPKDPARGSSDPYVKLQLLPDKQHKVKTRVLRKTRNPVYDEDFTFYGIGRNQLSSVTLHFVVLSFDRYSRDDVIGEVFCPLDATDVVEQIATQQVALSRDIQPRNMKMRSSDGRGELLVSLCWQPAANRLTVVVLKARNVPKMDVTGLADPYVKIYLSCKGQRIAKKKTHVKKRTLSPVFNESFVFDVPDYSNGNALLNDVSLEFLLLDWDRVTKNEVIGRLEMGGSKCTGSALHHWNEVCNSPRRQIADWHKLRE